MTSGVASWEKGDPVAVFDRPLPIWIAAVAAAALTEFLLHNVLFYSASLGLGFTLATTAVASLIFFSGHLTGTQPSFATRAFAGGMVFFGLFVSLRASPTLNVLNVLTVLALLVGAAFLYSKGRLWDMHLTDYPRAGIVTAANALVQTGEFLNVDVRQADLLPKHNWARVRPYVRGALIAAGPLAVFLALFASADAVFANFVQDVFSVDLNLGVLGWAISVVVGFAWLLIGLLRFGSVGAEMETIERPHGVQLGHREAATVLTLVNGLFAVFVAIQFAYLFGGADTIARTGGLTRAEYARQGFLQLVVVSGFVLALVLVVDWWSRPAGTRASRLVNGLQAGLVVLTGVVLLSAVERMRLYVDAFGLTELRFYALAVMVWIGVLLVWTLVTVLPGHRALFGAGTFLSGLILIASLNLVNPDATIARTNIDRYLNQGATIDLTYLVNNLSDDAVPVLRGNADSFPELVIAPRKADATADWRSYNRSRALAGN